MLLGACAHTDATTSGSGLQVSGNAVTAALVAGVIIAGTMSERDDPPPRYRSISEWFWGPPAPAMDPGRTVSEQDCSKPIPPERKMLGNLKCR